MPSALFVFSFCYFHPSIHPSIYLHPLIRGRVTEGKLPFSWLHQPALTGVSWSIPSLCGDIVPPPDPHSALWPPPSWTCLEHLPGDATRWHPYQMLKPPQLAPFYAKEQRLYSESLSDDRASHPIPKGDAGHPPEKTPFWPIVSVISFFQSWLTLHDHWWG